MLEKLKKEVLKANLELVKNGLVTLTWGNVSGIDRRKGLVVIKPSGVLYEDMTVNDMVVVDLEGNVVEGYFKPSSDTATHLEIYKAFENVGGIVHTHSSYATSWAQAGVSITCYGTTHADYFYGDIPCLRCLTEEEIKDSYERNTGLLITSEFSRLNLDYEEVPACLLKNHGPFTWGKNPMDALENAIVLEECAKMAYRSLVINPNISPVSKEIKDKHYNRKHGKNAYYGQ